ncbi:MAG TPA: PfkB family carbohydrate kinase [Terracidiphilus sp.]|nr:PfkB family carbohydrate kinase [Terracidiphilus sp.]
MAGKQAGKEAKFDLVVFGEFFSDMIFYRLPRRPRFGEESKTGSFLVAPGGGLSTTAIAASRLGTVTGIITRVGADAEYLPTWNQIVQEKLDIGACEYRKDAPTALTVCIAYKTDRMMVTHEPINQRLEELLDRPAVMAKLHQARHVHVACALRRPAKWQPALRSLRDRGVTVSADFGWNPDISVKQLISIIRHCDFVFPNQREACAVTGATTPMSALEKLQDWVKVPVVKLGAKGALLMSEGRIYRQPAPALPLVDATGVGDAFNGGFLHAYLHGAGWDDCLRAGNLCGSMAGTQPGGSEGLPGPQEYKRRLAEMRKR